MTRSAIPSALVLSQLFTAALAIAPLRILPLGDSVTKGSHSSTGDGYRGFLYERLVDQSDTEVDMVGTQSSGEMEDNDHEGHSGKFIEDLRDYSQRAIDADPNVVLLHVGVNDMDAGYELDSAPMRMGDILDLVHESVPSASLLVMPVLFSWSPRIQNRTEVFNKALDKTIKDKRDDGWRILSVSTNITKAELYDIKHPNDEGYKRMAQAWYGGIMDANRKGWIQEPTEKSFRDVKDVGLGLPKDREEYQKGDESAGARLRPLFGLDLSRIFGTMTGSI